MRVLYLTNIPTPYRVDFFNELGKYCKLTVLFERNDADNRENQWLKNENYNFQSIYLKGKKIGVDSAISFEIIKYLNKTFFDIIIVGGYSTPTGILAINYMKLRKIPFGINADGAFINHKENFLKKFIKKYNISAAKFWLSTGKDTTNYFKYYGGNSRQIYTYPFTSLLDKDILKVPIEKINKERLKEKLGIKEKRVILAVGQFIHRKGFDVLLKATEDISKEFGVYIVGGTPNKELLDLKEKLNNNSIHFIEFKSKSKLRDYYLASDVFVLPTREDIWGLVINEAMAHGLPIITTEKCIAGLELVKNGENGFIVPIDDSNILAKRIMDVIEDENSLNDMSIKSLNAIQEYTIENMAKEHIEIFKKILE